MGLHCKICGVEEVRRIHIMECDEALGFCALFGDKTLVFDTNTIELRCLSCNSASLLVLRKHHLLSLYLIVQPLLKVAVKSHIHFPSSTPCLLSFSPSFLRNLKFFLSQQFSKTNMSKTLAEREISIRGCPLSHLYLHSDKPLSEPRSRYQPHFELRCTVFNARE
jgi:hypothetical protein